MSPGHAQLLRRARARRRRSRGRAATHHRPDRPQRRRQDHAVQLRLRARAGRRRPHHVRRPRHHAAGGRTGSARSGWCAHSRSRAAFRGCRCWRTCCSTAPRQPGESLRHARCCARSAMLERETALYAARARGRRAAQPRRACSTRRAAALSGGQKKLLEIGRALMAEPQADAARRAGRRRQPDAGRRDRRAPARRSSPRASPSC